MAASRRPVGDSDSESSDDQERFREAAWEPPGGAIGRKVAVSSALPSLRVEPDGHEHDGNELQTTPEFRSHVAKKLAAILDSCIKETSKSNTLQDRPELAPEKEDECFRLFFTSLPGDTGTVTPPTCSRRKVVSSCSEDSDEERLRCQEAAVSAADILRHSALQSHQKDKFEDVCDQPPQKKRKKKKKKKTKEGEEENEEAHERQIPEIQPGKNGLRKKRKKKKKQRVDLEVHEELAGKSEDD